MLRITHNRGAGKNCAGFTRRTALQVGTLGATGLSLAGLQQLQAAGIAPKNNKSVILIWLDGGPSQLESYDPKPDAPSDYRGPFGVVQTKLPGVFFSETIPLQAARADKFSVVRSVSHGTGDHFAGAHWMLTGRFGSTSVNLPQKFPSVGSFVSKMHGANAPGMPAYVGLPAAESVYLFPGYQGAAYLGGTYNPFDFNREESYLHFSYKHAQVKLPKFLQQGADADALRIDSRRGLLGSLDRLDRLVDRSGAMDTFDRHQQNAVSLVLGAKAREAFDIERESKETRVRYGENPWGQYTLMARRLVENGVAFCTVDMPHWDDHSSIKEGHGKKLEAVDQAVAALIDDLSERNRLQDVLVVVMGEFGRTPRINNGQPGIPIPGRDHWGDAISVMLAGGGLKGGVVVGSTNDKAEHPIDRPLKPADILATIYRVMGIDTTTAFNDYAGRPTPILSEGEPIAELL